jgi:futalosine hydrolase
MSLKILYVTATTRERDILKKIRGLEKSACGFRFGDIEIVPLVTGVGSISTAWMLTKWFSSNELPDVAINGGIAGSFTDDLYIGQVVIPSSDCFADAGIEDGNNFLTLAEAGLADPEVFPFSSGKILCSNKYFDLASGNLKTVTAITVNTATGSDQSVKKLLQKFNPEIETLEGATFFYICAMEKVPFLALRAISNKVELRDLKKWNIPVAIQNLSEKMEDLLNKLV